MNPHNPEQGLDDVRRQEIMAEMAKAEKELLQLEQERNERNDAYVQNSYESADPLDRANAAQDTLEDQSIHQVTVRANEAFAQGDKTRVEDARAELAEKWAGASMSELILSAKKAHDAGNADVLGDIETMLVDKASEQAEREQWTAEQQTDFIDRTMKRIYGAEEATAETSATDGEQQADANTEAGSTPETGTTEQSQDETSEVDPTTDTTGAAEPSEADPVAPAEATAAEAAAETEDGTEEEQEAEVNPTPADDLSDRGIRGRTRKVMERIKNMGWNAYAKTADYYDGFKNDSDVADERLARRRKWMTAAVVGAVGVAAFYFSSRHGVDAAPKGGGSPVDLSVNPPTPKPEVHHLASETLNVSKGNGFEDAFQHQYKLTDAEAHKMYEHVKPALEGLKGTYTQGGDIRISDPGSFHISSEAQRLAEEYLKSIGRK